MKKRNLFLCFLLSLFSPGLGQIYNGQIRFGFSIYFVIIFFIFLVIVTENIFIFLISIFLAISITLFSIITSVYKSYKIKEIQLTKFNKIYLYLVMLIFLQVLNQLAPIYGKFDSFSIPAKSMQPTLIVGDYIYVKKNYYLKNEIEYGDLIIFKTNEDVDYVKRVIGLPGDTIQIINGVIFLNNIKVNKVKTQDFVETDSLGNTKRIRKYKEELFDIEYEVLDIMDNGVVDNTPLINIPSDYYFVMGDNRDNSNDSRLMGNIDKDKILHKVHFIWWAKNKSRIGIYPK